MESTPAVQTTPAQQVVEGTFQREAEGTFQRMDPEQGIIQRWQPHEGHCFTKPYPYRQRRADGKKPRSEY